MKGGRSIKLVECLEICRQEGTECQAAKFTQEVGSPTQTTCSLYDSSLDKSMLTASADSADSREIYVNPGRKPAVF